MKKITGLLFRFWLALNQSTLLIITGQNDFTISGWSYMRKVNDGKPRWNVFVDWLFHTFAKQTHHCQHAFLWEWQSARRITVAGNGLYISAHTELYGVAPANALDTDIEI